MYWAIKKRQAGDIRLPFFYSFVCICIPFAFSFSPFTRM